jgi:hypothetical protein
MAAFFTVEDSFQLAGGIFNSLHMFEDKGKRQGARGYRVFLSQRAQRRKVLLATDTHRPTQTKTNLSQGSPFNKLRAGREITTFSPVFR